MESETIAKVCHEINKALCEANGDTSQKGWDEAEVWQKESTLKSVEFALAGIRTPAEQHDAWATEKTKAGWKYGPVKDAVKKLHPYLVPFEQLPQMEKTKDYLFVAIVNALKDT